MKPVILIALLLAGCCDTKVVYKDHVVEKPVPVFKSVPADLLTPCTARTAVPPTGPLTVAATLERLDAVEIALAMCANQIELIRDKQPAP